MDGNPVVGVSGAQIYVGALGLAAVAGWIFWRIRSEPSRPPWIGNPEKEPGAFPSDRPEDIE